ALVPTAAPSEGSSDSEVRLVDPVRSSSGLATLALISNTIDDADQEGRPQLVAALQSLQKGATPTEEAAFEAFAEQSSGDGADPVRSSSGLATLALISNTIDDADQEGRPQLVAALQSLQKGATPTEEAAFEAFAEQSSGDGADPVLVLSEQAALRYNHDHGDAPAHVRYPKGGSYSLDYP